MTDSDRRQFFRINDRIGVAYRVLSDEESRAEVEQSRRLMAPEALLADYNKTVHQLLGQLKVQQPVMAELLGALDDKINFVINQLELESSLVEKMAHEMKAVNISASGLAFNVSSEVASGKLVALELLLQPENLHLYIHGEVVDSTARDDQPGYYMRVKFTHVSPSDQELLIQHVVRRQGAQLRYARED
ncbi:MAG: hypothetical protein AseanaTS_22430 [Candidatus Pelagadaptatus aseana]|uniref:PilZ domain-containing protein n=1 Tax=Candidatus Pelagadaptatus aseana TaxID=3120508 RepID=UPI0039B20C28